MWLLFAAAVLISVVVLYLPGYFAGRAVRLGRMAALAAAPAFSVVMLVLLGIVLRELNIACPAWALFAASLVIALVAYGTSRILPGWGGKPNREGAISWKLVGAYVGVSLLVSAMVFLHAMGDPSGFCRLDDSVAHYSNIRAFLDTGFYSTLHASGYATLGDVGGYYPAAWHIAVAVVASLLGDAASLASNAMMLVVCAVVLPVGLLFMLQQLFPQREQAAVVAAGALMAVAFCCFPWGFLVWGQLLPNLLSFSFIPAAMGLLIAASRKGEGCASSVVSLVVAFAVCVIAVAFAQPNGVFSLGIWAVVFVVSWILRATLLNDAVSRKGLIAAAAFFACACVAWTALYFAPPLHTVTTYTWEAFLSPAKALIAGLAFMFFERVGVQPFLTVLVALSIIRLCKERQHRWLIISFLFAFAVWFIAATTDGPVKQFLSGFWYTDYRRVAGMASLFAIPLAAVGFAWLFEWLKNLLTKRAGSLEAKRAGALSLAALLVVMAVVQFCPAHVMVGDSDIRAGLMAVHKQVKSRYSWEKYYTAEESAFVKECQNVIPEDALVANFPNDGSCYAYGIDGLNTFFRRSSPSAYFGPEETGRLLRTALSSVAASPTVQKAVKDSGVRYVLLLDEGSNEETRTVSKLRYKQEDWAGIESINDETLGFTVVLSEGDMRLYRIDAAFGA